MSLIDNFLEPFELVDSKGTAYGEIQAVFMKEQNKISAKGEPPINDYDIIRRKSDGSAFRIFSVKSCAFPNGKDVFTTASLVPYKLWEGEYIYSP